jgi:hypothetical protein
MEVRDSGMLDVQTWDRFFDARKIPAALGFDDAAADVVDSCCRYGTFTIAAARLTEQ